MPAAEKRKSESNKTPAKGKKKKSIGDENASPSLLRFFSKKTNQEAEAASSEAGVAEVVEKGETHGAAEKMGAVDDTKMVEEDDATAKMNVDDATAKTDDDEATSKMDDNDAAATAENNDATATMEEDDATDKMDDSDATAATEDDDATAKIDDDDDTAETDDNDATATMEDDDNDVTAETEDDDSAIELPDIEGKTPVVALQQLSKEECDRVMAAKSSSKTPKTKKGRPKKEDPKGRGNPKKKQKIQKDGRESLFAGAEEWRSRVARENSAGELLFTGTYDFKAPKGKVTESIVWEFSRLSALKGKGKGLEALLRDNVDFCRSYPVTTLLSPLPYLLFDFPASHSSSSSLAS